MPHFDLTADQRARLKKALVADYDEDTLDDLLMTLNQSLAAHAASNRAYPLRVNALIKSAESQGWVFDLASGASRANPKDSALQVLVQELEPQAPKPNVDHFERCKLEQGYVMVNRAPLRAALRNLISPGGKRILVVRGHEGKLGYSHSLQLVSYLNGKVADFHLVYVDLERLAQAVGTGANIDPAVVGRNIAKLLPFETDELDEKNLPKNRQWSTWVVDYVTDLETAVTARQETVWFVIDSFNKISLPQSTLDLVKDLAHRINKTLKKARLVLLGYADSLPPQVLPYIEEEKLTRIRLEEVTEFVARAFEQCNRPLDEAKVRDCVTQLIEGIDFAASGSVVVLGERASAEISRWGSR